jgi:hypothetical protein
MTPQNSTKLSEIRNQEIGKRYFCQSVGGDYPAKIMRKRIIKSVLIS